LRLIWWDVSNVGPEMILEADRQLRPTALSRKRLENVLATTALDELVGENFDWRSVPVKQARTHIRQRLEANNHDELIGGLGTIVAA
jgi:hypothetical protein